MADKIHKCEICGKYFTRNTTLIKHLEKNYACKRNIKDGLREDIIKSLRTKTCNTVNGIKVYYCKFCNSEFSSKQLKYKHQLSCVEQTTLNNKIAMLNNLATYIDKVPDIQSTEEVLLKIDSKMEITIDTKKQTNILQNSSIENNSGQIYLIQEREFIKTGETIYKIGKTTKTIQNRMRGYPKGSRLLLAIEVEDCHTREKELIKLFDNKFKKRKDIGTEYFEGCEKEMIAYIVSN